MNTPSPNTRWARAIAAELAGSDVRDVCITPGSRCTPLTDAFSRHEKIDVFSHLDERSSAFFALGRARVTGRPTPLVCTSGTGAANFHPAVLEANRSRVPMLLLTADRPPELLESGANQTVDQNRLYGSATRWFRQLPEPGTNPRKLRALRTLVCRAVRVAGGPPAGPVHLNVPFRKPLEPTRSVARTANSPSDGVSPKVRWSPARIDPDPEPLRELLQRLQKRERGLLWCGPRNPFEGGNGAIARLSRATGFPLLADPLSGLRHGPWVNQTPVLGGYDGFLHPALPADPPPPEIVVRLGGAPTASRTLLQYFNQLDATQITVRSDADWEDPAFRTGWFIEAEASRLAEELSDRLESPGVDEPWRREWEQCEANYWKNLEGLPWEDLFEGFVVREIVRAAPEEALLFVSNSLPVRDLQRYAPPTGRRHTLLGNRGVSGIDGILSSAFGAGSAASNPLLVITGDIAFSPYIIGLLALERLGLDAPVFVFNNDGGGIFHMLPIEDHDPPFTPYVKTPHGLEFEHAAHQYNCRYRKVRSPGELSRSLEEALRREGSHVIEVPTDAEASQRRRERLLRSPTE